jgi:diadenosine tetraphosphatase ApaH/serine/threonine PP2A family protein phosphatase
MHGGFGPDLARKNKEGLGIINAVKRPIEVPERGLIADLLWADPSTNK